MKPIAIVIPWFDEKMTGGAERQAFQIATRLAQRGHLIEVLTTCNGGFSTDWSVNHYPPGSTTQFGLKIRRFAVDQRASEAFDRVNAKLLQLEISKLHPGVSPLTPDEGSVFVNENIKSSALLEYLDAERDAYRAFLFVPYMFQTTTMGAPIVSDRAWLQPCLHNEPAAYLTEIAEVFRCVHGVLFNSEGEYELALDLYGPGIVQRSQVISEGTEPIGAGAELPDQLHGKRFLLYLGRREAVKNIDMLLRAFRAFRQTSNSPLDLVLAGPGTESLSEANVIDLELISDELKASLLRLATAVVQPSTNESFSRTMMEAWSVGRPVVVNANCLATAKAVSRSGGGWSAATEAEWVAAFHEIENTSSSELARLGELGRLYADEHADWDKIISRYEKLFDLNQTESQTKVRRTNLAAIHQLLPDMVYGDAISNQALAIRERLRANGYESEIFAKRCEDRMRASALLSDETQPEPEAALLYHHSIGSELTSLAVNHQGPKCLIYHNITPAQYFAPYRPGFAWMLDTGRKSLKRLAPYFEVSVGDSAYNARELAAHGFNNPGVLPIVIDPHRWNMIPDQNQMRCGQDGRTNILFTGRIAPNKKQDRLVEAFSHFQELLPESRLIIVGEGRLSDPFFHHLLGTIKRFNLESAVEVTGVVEEETLLAYYRTSHLYWSFSEHEGFGAPLVEAMWFDIPVCALEVTAVSETVGQAGVLFELDEDVSTVARRAYRLVTDEEFRQSIIDKQRLRRADFTPDSVWPILAGLVDRLATKPIISAVA